jgi:hypothetical protein
MNTHVRKTILIALIAFLGLATAVIQVAMLNWAR